MDLNHLQAFVRVVELGGFTKAAHALGLAKSRVSRHVAALESELGTSLLYRTSRQLSLTDAGRDLFARSRPHLEGLAAASRALGESEREVRGVLRVTTTADIGQALLAPVLARLAEAHPRLAVELRLGDEVVDLVKDGVDVALRVGAMRDSGLRSLAIGRVAFVLVASAAYLGRSPRIARAADLEEHATLAFTSMSTKDRWRLTVGGKREELAKIRPVCRANDPHVLRELTAAGRGVALLPEFLCVDALRAGRLVRVLESHATRPLPVRLVWPAEAGKSAKVRALIDLAAPLLRPYFA